MKLKYVLNGLLTLFIFAMSAFFILLLSDHSSGLSVSVTTNQTSYRSDEPIGIALEIENTHAATIRRLVLENQVPQGYTTSQTSQNQTQLEKLDPEGQAGINSVFVNEKTTQQITDTLLDEQPAAKTQISFRDHSALIALFTGGCLLIVIALWIIHHRRPYRFLPALYLGIACLGACLPPFLLLYNQNKTIQIKTQITIDDQPLTLVSTIHYTQDWNLDTSTPLEDLEVSQNQFAVGLEDQTLFTVNYHPEVSSSQPSGTLTLCHLTEGRVGEMYDDGTHGDLVSQDGIYSLLMDVDTTQAASDQYYATDGNHISNTQTLRIFNQPTSEDQSFCEQLNAKMHDIQGKYADDFGYIIAQDIDHALDDMTQYARRLYANGSLLSYERNEDNLLLQLYNGMWMMFVPQQRGVDAFDQNTEVSVMSLQPCLDMYDDEEDDYIPLPEGINDRMALPDDAADALAETFDQFTKTEYDNEAVDLECVRAFGPNQVIIWHGHGDYTRSKHSVLLTGDEFDFGAWLFDINYFLDNIRGLTINYNGKVGISAAYIDKYVDSMDHSFLYLAACSSGKDNVLAQAFLNKGAEAVVANSTTIYTLYNLMMQQTTLTLMSQLNPATLNYYTLSEALAQAKTLYGNDDHQYGAKPEGAAEPLIFGGQTAQNYRLAEVQKGTLSGKICLASDRTTPVGNAAIQIYYGDTLHQTLTADYQGQYSVELSAADYRLVVSREGYLDFEAYATVSGNENTYLETFLLIENADAQNGTASGQITDAFTGKGLQDVTLEVRHHWNNPDQGDVISSVETNQTGEYTLTLPLGNYTLLAKKEGYIETSINIIVQEGTTAMQNGAVTPIVPQDELRMVLTWQKDPADLDSHVQGSAKNNQAFHIHYADRSVSIGGTEIGNLDVDDTTSYGPETITLNTKEVSTVYYYIHRYAGGGSLAASEAQVSIYQGSTLVYRLHVPSDGDAALDYWNVFAFKNGRFIIKNQLAAAPDIAYAS